MSNASWEKLSTKLSDCQDTISALEQSGLNWDVQEEALYAGGRYINTHKALVRSDTRDILSVVGRNFKPLQNREAFQYFDQLIREGDLKLESAGTFDGGKNVWIKASTRYASKEAVPGDTVGQGVILSHGNDGHHAISVRPYIIRLICGNGMTTRIEQAGIRVSHTRSMDARLEMLRHEFERLNEEFTRSIETYGKMAQRQLRHKEFQEYVRTVFDKEREELGAEFAQRGQLPDDHEEVMAGLLAGARNQVDGQERQEMAEELLKLPRAYDDIEHAYNHAPGASPGNLWGAYNAITYHVDHQRGRSDSTRAQASWFGAGRQLRDRAYDVAMDILKK